MKLGENWEIYNHQVEKILVPFHMLYVSFSSLKVREKDCSSHEARVGYFFRNLYFNAEIFLINDSFLLNVI